MYILILNLGMVMGSCTNKTGKRLKYYLFSSSNHYKVKILCFIPCELSMALLTKGGGGKLEHSSFKISLK